MKPNQKYTPKYWVVHDKTTDDIFADTMKKSREDTILEYKARYEGNRLGEDPNIEVILVDVKIRPF